jgi:hypothetical protein
LFHELCILLHKQNILHPKKNSGYTSNNKEPRVGFLEMVRQAEFWKARGLVSQENHHNMNTYCQAAGH